MDIKFRCPQCFRKIAAESEHKGAQINCPACGYSMTVPESSFGIGTEIEGFTIERYLGSGAMGEVYLAKQSTMNREVALKIMTNDSMTQEDDKERFVREVQTLAKLNHPNIVSAISAGEFEHGAFLAMTYITGSTVEDKVQRDGPMNEKDALNCIIAVADALKYAWDNRKILHRDIKPANFMIDDGGEVHLMDMGIAKSMESDYDITVAGMVMGTPYYMSPEQSAAEKLDQQSDIYSLGASLYHMVTGNPPYKGGSPMQIMAKKLSEDPEEPKRIKPEISDRMNTLIKKFMAIDKKKRVQDWDEAIELLKKAKSPKKSGKKIHVNSHNADTAGRTVQKTRKKSSPMPVIVATIMVVAAAILFFVLK